MLPTLVGISRAVRRACLPMAVVAAGFALAGCGDASPESVRAERFPYIQDPNFQVENPSRDHASATGIGCGATEKSARIDARKTAKFNLLGVTGNANYKIRFAFLRKIPREGTVCVEVKATAVDSI